MLFRSVRGQDIGIARHYTEIASTANYPLAAKYKRQALAVLTISDNIVTQEQTSAEERQTTFKTMMEIALEAIIA